MKIENIAIAGIVLVIFGIAAVFANFVVNSSSTKKAPVSVQGESELYRYEDKESGVTCYRVSGREGLSCLQLEKK